MNGEIMTDEIKEGQTVWVATFDLATGKAGTYFKHYTGNGIQVQFPEGLVGAFSAESIYKTKNAAIDGMIAHLESLKDHIIHIERRKCPECQTEFSDIAGLVSTLDGEEWHMTCNNRDCNYVYIQKVKREIEVIE